MRVETCRTALLTLTVLALLSSGFAYADNIYVSCLGNGTIERFDSSGNATLFASDLNDPAGLAFDSNGYLYLAKFTYGGIGKFDSSGDLSIFASGLNGPVGLAFDSNGYLYTANVDDGTIGKFDSSGNGSTFASGLNSPVGLAFGSNGYLYTANAGDGTIEKFDSSGNGSTFASGLNSPEGLAFDNNGYLYVANSGGGTIGKFDSSGNGSTFASGLNSPIGLAFDSSGYLYVANAGDGTIMRFDSSGNGTLFASDLNEPVFIATQVLPVKVTKCSVTAGSKENTDKISFSGMMYATANDFNGANNSSDANFVEVTISDENAEDMAPCVFTFPVNNKTFKKGKFSSTITNKPSKTSFAFDTKTSKFSFVASDINLLGLLCPFDVRIDIGDYNAETNVDETIVNGTKPIPINLLMGVKNSLRVDKPKFTKKSDVITQLAISGGFSVEDINDANLVTNQLDITVGSQTFTIPAGKFKNTKNKFTCSKVDTSKGIAAVTFDFNKCTFTLTIKNTSFTAAAGDTVFEIAFASFSGSDEVTLP